MSAVASTLPRFTVPRLGLCHQNVLDQKFIGNYLKFDRMLLSHHSNILLMKFRVWPAFQAQRLSAVGLVHNSGTKVIRSMWMLHQLLS